MIAACPTCGARYRIDAGKVRPEGARLRCTRCETVFRVHAPDAPQTETRSEPAASAGPAADAAPRYDRERLVLIASPEEDAGKRLASIMATWGLETILVHDGVEAILNIQRALPRAVVLDAALPKMFGFQICELMKRNESLRSIQVALIGAIHNEDRYRRPPEEIYGADAYAERQNLPDALYPILQRFGLPLQSDAAAVPSAAARAPSVAPTPVPKPAAPTRPTPAPPASVAPAASAGSPEREQAERLARIIVSDIVLYNQEKFDAAVRAGNVLEALADELAEGQALFAGRVDPSVGDAQELLKAEILRMARSKGMN
jgi:predicted Zn finger-like uncharacterized protein